MYRMINLVNGVIEMFNKMVILINKLNIFQYKKCDKLEIEYEDIWCDTYEFLE